MEKHRGWHANKEYRDKKREQIKALRKVMDEFNFGSSDLPFEVQIYIEHMFGSLHQLEFNLGPWFAGSSRRRPKE